MGEGCGNADPFGGDKGGGRKIPGLHWGPAMLCGDGCGKGKRRGGEGFWG